VARTDYIAAQDAKTLDGLFRERVRRSAKKVSHVAFEAGRWRARTWEEMYRETGRWQAGFAREGLKAGDRVALMLRNSPEWVLFDQAALASGLVVVPLYTVDRPDNVAYVLGHSGAKLVLFDTQEQWEQFRVLELDLPGVERILILNPSGSAFGDPRARPVKDWLRDPAAMQHPFEDGSRLASIIYTSGTTGRPKGVMLSHWNMLANCRDALACGELFPEDEFLSFLPLSHTYERTVGLYAMIMAGVKTTYARSIPQLAEDLRIVRPTVFHAVPRVYERVWNAIRAKLEAAPEGRRRLFYRTVDIGWRRFEWRQGRGKWQADFLLYPFLKTLVSRKVLAALGGRLRGAGSGGAALAPEIARVFIGLGLPVTQGYGMTEASPVICTNREDDNLPRSVGRPIPNVELRIGEDGALRVRGPNVMLGYWNDPEATRAAIDSQGWLNTGDVASIDGNGYVTITGRTKDILVLANGEKMPPADIEQAILEDGLFDQAMVIGEGKPYLAAILVPNAEQWKSLGPEERREEALLARIAGRMRRFPGYAQVRRVAVAAEPWSVENGLLTPTLKAKRARILERHASEIASLYAGH
jgi:long-chain acyl-CoA synthetase